MKAGGGWSPGLAPGLGGEQTPERDPAGAEGGQDSEEAAATAARFAAMLRPSQPPGAAVLAGMGGTPPPAASPAARLVEELAQRLLVSEDAGSGTVGGAGQAVRALASADVGVPGLEVVVRREPGGGLVVELLAEHPADLALLRGGAAELAGRLEARFGGRAEVRVARRGPPGDSGGEGPPGDRPA